MLYIDGDCSASPHRPTRRERQWQSMAGRSGQLHTGHCVMRLRDDKVSHRARESSVTTVHFGTPSAADLDAYIDSGEPLRVAGGFTLDGLGGWFVDRIDGDPSNVIGLSLPLTGACWSGWGCRSPSCGRPIPSHPERGGFRLKS